MSIGSVVVFIFSLLILVIIFSVWLGTYQFVFFEKPAFCRSYLGLLIVHTALAYSGYMCVCVFFKGFLSCVAVDIM